MTLRDLTPWFGRNSIASRRWSENPFASLHREVDRMLGDFLTGTDLSPWSGLDDTGRLIPKMDVAELENGYEITADLPGVEEKDIDVSVSEGVLCLTGERKSEKEEKKKNFHRIERSFGRFERAIALPDGVDPDKIIANFKQGVLRVTLPKSAKAKETAKKIEVKAA